MNDWEMRFGTVGLIANASIACFVVSNYWSQEQFDVPFMAFSLWVIGTATNVFLIRDGLISGRDA